MAPQASSTAVRRTVAIDAEPEPITIDTAATAAVVVDMQNDFCTKGEMLDRAGIDIAVTRNAIAPTAQVVAALRTVGIPVIYLKMGFRADLADFGADDAPNRIKHRPLAVGTPVTAPDGRESRILIRDTWNTDIVEELTPTREDIVLYKTRYSGFYGTELEEVLKRRAIQSLVITGVSTSVCVESTVRDAMFRDYRCVVLADCTGEPIGHTLPRTNHEASLLVIQRLFGWVSSSAKVLHALGRGV